MLPIYVALVITSLGGAIALFVIGTKAMRGSLPHAVAAPRSAIHFHGGDQAGGHAALNILGAGAIFAIEAVAIAACGLADAPTSALAWVCVIGAAGALAITAPAAVRERRAVGSRD